MGRIGKTPNTREFPVTGLPYTIVYRVKDDALDVVTVVHQNRNFP